MNAELLTAGLLLFGIWSVLCRLNKLQHGVSQTVVFLQHLVLGMGLAAAMLLPMQWGVLTLAAAVAVYLAAGAHRWRFAAPEGTTTRPAELSGAALQMVSEEDQHGL